MTGFEANVFDAGDKYQSVLLQPWNIRVGILICYDIEFPECARILFLQQVDILLVPTALAASDPLEGPQVIPQCVIPCRALENSFYIMYANFPFQIEETTEARLTATNKPIEFCGLSCIVSAEGKDLCRAALHSQELLVTHLDFDQRKLIQQRNPYQIHRLPPLYHSLVQ